MSAPPGTSVCGAVSLVVARRHLRDAELHGLPRLRCRMDAEFHGLPRRLRCGDTEFAGLPRRRRLRAAEFHGVPLHAGLQVHESPRRTSLYLVFSVSSHIPLHPDAGPQACYGLFHCSIYLRSTVAYFHHPLFEPLAQTYWPPLERHRVEGELVYDSSDDSCSG